MTKNSISNKISLILAWILIFVASIFPEVVINEIIKISIPTWLFWVKIGILAILIISCGLFEQLHSLRRFSFLLATLLLLEYGASFIQNAPWWKNLFHGSAFVSALANQQILRVLTALVMATILFMIYKKFSAFYLVKGDLKAEAAPIPLLMSRPSSWNKLGWILAACISGGTLVFLVIGASSSLGNLSKVIPILPIILIFALMNSFGEEMSYRAGFLAVLEPEFGKNQSLLMTAALFGMGHYYGVPYGILGVIMASILGWFLGKSMLETRGFAWAWFIHFLQDVLIFTFIAVGSISVGG